MELVNPEPLVAEQRKETPFGPVSALCVCVEHGADASPEGPVCSFHFTVTSVVYQPALPNVPVTVAVMSGAVASRLIVTLWVADKPALFVAVQARVTPGVSLVILAAPQPLEDKRPDPPSSIV